MANTYTQIRKYIFNLFLWVKYRDGLIHCHSKRIIPIYFGIIKANNHKLLAINGMSDHIHILIGMRPTQSISELMQTIKANSFQNGLMKKCFESKILKVIQSIFLYSKSHVQNVIKYIQNQEERHKIKTFQEEYLEFLEALKLGRMNVTFFKEPYLMSSSLRDFNS